MPGEYGGSPDVFFRGVPMGLRPTKVDEKHTHRRRPGEYGASPGVFFSGAAQWTLSLPDRQRVLLSWWAARALCRFKEAMRHAFGIPLPLPPALPD